MTKDLTYYLFSNLNHLITKGFGLCHCAGFRVDADDGLCVGFAEVHPLLLGLEANLDTVNGVHIFLGVDDLELAQNLLNEGGVAELDLVLGDEILRVGLL